MIPATPLTTTGSPSAPARQDAASDLPGAADFLSLLVRRGATPPENIEPGEAGVDDGAESDGVAMPAAPEDVADVGQDGFAGGTDIPANRPAGLDFPKGTAEAAQPGGAASNAGGRTDPGPFDAVAAGARARWIDQPGGQPALAGAPPLSGASTPAIAPAAGQSEPQSMVAVPTVPFPPSHARPDVPPDRPATRAAPNAIPDGSATVPGGGEPAASSTDARRASQGPHADLSRGATGDVENVKSPMPAPPEMHGLAAAVVVPQENLPTGMPVPTGAMAAVRSDPTRTVRMEAVPIRSSDMRFPPPPAGAAALSTTATAVAEDSSRSTFSRRIATPDWDLSAGAMAYSVPQTGMATTAGDAERPGPTQPDLATAEVSVRTETVVRTADAPLAAASLPRAILARLQAAIATPPPVDKVQRTEISLAPAELGRVTFILSNDDGRLTMQVLAERPETLELVRRHADALERAASDGPVRLRLEQEGAGARHERMPQEQMPDRRGSPDAPDDQPTAHAGIQAMPAEAGPHAVRLTAGRLDLRL